MEKNGTEYEGVITEVGSMVDMATGLFKVKATLADADGLANGTMVKLYVVSQKAENVMTVPVDCVSYSGGDAFVYTYDEAESRARKVFVEDGLMDSGKVEIRSGLTYEDAVITTWTKEIYDGAPVRLAGEEADGGAEDETGKEVDGGAETEASKEAEAETGKEANGGSPSGEGK